LRRTSLDELPQLWNVLLGNMSLVGPRPPLLSEVLEYEAWQLGRLAVKPGMTGLWQVSGRSNLTFTEMVELDIAYVESWSIKRDIVLLLKTPLAVLTARGAY
jgi:lipopolysaccharide/colanic/teichoic acid biosynthesis glycosyltransferase